MLPNFFVIKFFKILNLKLLKNLTLQDYSFASNGGFGHQVLVNDMIRYEDKSVLYILFYDPSRFNKYVSEIFNIKSIYLKTCYGKICLLKILLSLVTRRVKINK